MRKKDKNRGRSLLERRSEGSADNLEQKFMEEIISAEKRDISQELRDKWIEDSS